MNISLASLKKSNLSVLLVSEDEMCKEIDSVRLQRYDSERVELKQLFTVANLLTVFRIILLPVLMWSLVMLPKGGTRVLPITIGAIMLLTDLVDGYFARILNQQTKLGSLLDPISDKLIVIGLGITLYILDYLPGVFLLFIFLRDLLITIFGLFVYFCKGDLMQTNIYARMTPLFWGVTYIVYVVGFRDIAFLCGIISVAITVVSGVLYFISFIKLLNREKSK